MTRKAIIVDIDGTLADCEHRRHFLDKKDWKGFFSKMSDDLIISWVRDLVENIAELSGLRIIIVTGRPSNYGGLTIEWLYENYVHYDAIFFRQEGDFRPDEIVKKEIYQTKIEPDYDVKYVIDDRSKVVKMWRDLGLNVLQCAEGNF